jgi:hypothetical protein
MVDLARVARDGGVLALVSCIYFPLVLRLNPRFARADLPKDIQEAVPPLTKKETRTAAVFFALILMILLAIPLVSTVGLRKKVEGSISFFWLFINAYGVLLIANIGELVLVDLLLLCTITPKWMVIPGTEGMAGYKDYGYQIRAHLRGAAFMALVASLIAGVVSLL